ncbi:unnamed protein product, partial [Meganyctiphanes norvegica]
YGNVNSMSGVRDMFHHNMPTVPNDNGINNRMDRIFREGIERLLDNQRYGEIFNRETEIGILWNQYHKSDRLTLLGRLFVYTLFNVEIDLTAIADEINTHVNNNVPRETQSRQMIKDISYIRQGAYIESDYSLNVNTSTKKNVKNENITRALLYGSYTQQPYIKIQKLTGATISAIPNNALPHAIDFNHTKLAHQLYDQYSKQVRNYENKDFHERTIFVIECGCYRTSVPCQHLRQYLVLKLDFCPTKNEIISFIDIEKKKIDQLKVKRFADSGMVDECNLNNYIIQYVITNECN